MSVYFFSFLSQSRFDWKEHAFPERSLLSDLCFCTRLLPSVRPNMAASAASREVFTEGVRAVLQTWPVLQVSRSSASGAAGRRVQLIPRRVTDSTITDMMLTASHVRSLCSIKPNHRPTQSIFMAAGPFNWINKG